MGIRMGLAAPENLPQLRLLWQEAFGDGEDYMNLYFDRRFKPHETYILQRDGKLVSMMTAMRVSLRTPDGSTLNGRYIYAVATQKDNRGKGCAKTLDRYMASDLQKHGVSFTCLVPAEDSLHRFYAAQGYQETFPRYTGTLARSASFDQTDIRPCPFTRFSAMRARFLTQISAKKAALFHPDPELSYIYEELHACDGQTVLFTEGGILRYAVLTLPPQDDKLVLRETDGSPLYAANILMHHFNRSKALIQHPFPFPGGKAAPYGMGRRLDSPSDSLPNGYTALMLD